MAAKKNNYIEEELTWLEKKAQDIKKFIDRTDYSFIDDRIVELQGIKGASETIAATKEAQQKAYREAIKEYTLIIEVINNLREREEAKIETRGKANLSAQAEEWLKNRKG